MLYTRTSYDVTAAGVVFDEEPLWVPLPPALTARSLMVYDVSAARTAVELLIVVIDIGEDVVPADFQLEPLSVEYS